MKGAEKKINITSVIVSEVNSVCSCGFALEHIISTVFNCTSLETTQVTIKAQISYFGLVKASDLVEIISLWVREGQHLVVDETVLYIDPTCPVEIDSLLTSDDCINDNITSTVITVERGTVTGMTVVHMMYNVITVGTVSATIIIVIIIVALIIVTTVCCYSRKKNQSKPPSSTKLVCQYSRVDRFVSYCLSSRAEQGFECEECQDYSEPKYTIPASRQAGAILYVTSNVAYGQILPRQKSFPQYPSSYAETHHYDSLNCGKRHVNIQPEESPIYDDIVII